MTSCRIGVFDLYIGKIKVVPKGWKRLLVPIKGYYYDDFELEKIMHLNGELYFIVKKEYQTYNVPFKKRVFTFYLGRVCQYGRNNRVEQENEELWR